MPRSTPSTHRNPRRYATLRPASILAATTLCTTFYTTACRTAIDAFGDAPAQALEAADAAFNAFQLRFDNVQRDSTFDRSRILMGRYALTPGRLFTDTTIWTLTSPGDSSRALFARAGYQNGAYRFSSATNAPYPDRLGDERHYIHLKSLGRSNYEWYTTVDHAIGIVRPAAVGAVIMAALTGFEGRSAPAALLDSRSTFPRAAVHLAQLFQIDSLTTSALDDGSTTATLSLRLRTDLLRQRYPSLAAYLDKYLTPSIGRTQITDRRGSVFINLTLANGRIVTQLRSRDHRLVSLDAGRPMPDSLLVVSDFSAKYRIFRVGYRNLIGDLTIERGTHERAWLFRFRKEPAWQFPLAVDKLIRAPLRRPFEGRGIEMRLGVRDDLGPQTMSVRYTHFIVNESAIMRWLGSLGASAFSEFSGPTEIQWNRFLYELFVALRADLAALR